MRKNSCKALAVKKTLASEKKKSCTNQFFHNPPPLPPSKVKWSTPKINNINNNLYLSVKAKIAVTEPLNGDTISEIYIYININVNIKVLKKKKTYFE